MGERRSNRKSDMPRYSSMICQNGSNDNKEEEDEDFDNDYDDDGGSKFSNEPCLSDQSLGSYSEVVSGAADDNDKRKSLCCQCLQKKQDCYCRESQNLGNVGSSFVQNRTSATASTLANNFVPAYSQNRASGNNIAPSYGNRASAVPVDPNGPPIGESCNPSTCEKRHGLSLNQSSRPSYRLRRPCLSACCKSINEGVAINLERTRRLCQCLRGKNDSRANNSFSVTTPSVNTNQNSFTTDYQDYGGFSVFPPEVVVNSECRNKSNQSQKDKCAICQVPVCVCSPAVSEPSCFPPYSMEQSLGVSELLQQRRKSGDSSSLSPEQWRNIQFQKLARDNYCPGTIQDAAESNINYNAMALKLMKETFGHIPKSPGPYIPLSLLEIFNRRVKNERSNIRYFLGDSMENYASDIEAYFQQKLHNDTNRAISSLLKAEKAYEATHQPDSLNVDLNITTVATPMPDNGIAVAYMGLITPR